MFFHGLGQPHHGIGEDGSTERSKRTRTKEQDRRVVKQEDILTPKRVISESKAVMVPRALPDGRPQCKEWRTKLVHVIPHDCTVEAFP